MKKSFITLVVLTFSVFSSFAQQDAQYSQNMFNRLAINPGYAGMNKAICGTLLGRQQWVSFPGAPKTFLLSVDAYVPPILGGLGLTIISDQLGFEKNFGAKLAYSYHKYWGPGVLGIGLEAGMLQKSISGIFISPDGKIDKEITDPSIPTSGAKSTSYDVGFGLYYSIADKLYFGISSTHIPAQDLKDPSLPQYKYDLARHYYILAGYSRDITASIALKPSVFIKSDATSTQLDVNLLAEFNNQFWGGVSYRVTDAIVALVGFKGQVPGGEVPGSRGSYKIGYSYDITTSALRVQSNGSHEIMLGYCYPVVPKPKKYSHSNVRNLP